MQVTVRWLNLHMLLGIALRSWHNQMKHNSGDLPSLPPPRNPREVDVKCHYQTLKWCVLFYESSWKTQVFLECELQKGQVFWWHMWSCCKISQILMKCTKFPCFRKTFHIFGYVTEKGWNRVLLGSLSDKLLCTGNRKSLVFLMASWFVTQYWVPFCHHLLSKNL